MKMKKYISFVGQILMGSSILLLVMKIFSVSIAVPTFLLGLIIYIYGTIKTKNNPLENFPRQWRLT